MREKFRRILVDYPENVATDTIPSKFSNYVVAVFNRGVLSWILSLDKQRKYKGFKLLVTFLSREK